MSGSGDGRCGGRRCLGDRGCRGFGGEVGLGGGEKAWGGRDWGAASSPRVFDVQFLQVLGTNVLSALVKAKLDQLKVN